MKYSKQREAILDYLHSTRSHPTADTIYENVRKIYPSISLGTVYRNLTQLSENGTVLKIETGSDKVHYDGFAHNHYHFVCTCCDAVQDVDMPTLDEINERVADSLGVRVDGNTMLFYGICRDCGK